VPIKVAKEGPGLQLETKWRHYYGSQISASDSDESCEISVQHVKYSTSNSSTDSPEQLEISENNAEQFCQHNIWNIKLQVLYKSTASLQDLSYITPDHVFNRQQSHTPTGVSPYMVIDDDDQICKFFCGEKV